MDIQEHKMDEDSHRMDRERLGMDRERNKMELDDFEMDWGSYETFLRQLEVEGVLAPSAPEHLLVSPYSLAMPYSS